MTKLDSILKCRDITFPTEVHPVKAMVFPVVMYGCGSWTIKKAESWKNDTFELWCWRRLLRVPWTARRSNQQILKKINPWIFTERTDAEAEAPILWPPDVKSQLIRKDPDVGRLKAGGEEDNRGRGRWMASPIQWTWVWANSRRWWTEKPGEMQSMRSQRVGHNWATEQQWKFRIWLEKKVWLNQIPLTGLKNYKDQ